MPLRQTDTLPNASPMQYISDVSDIAFPLQSREHVSVAHCKRFDLPDVSAWVRVHLVSADFLSPRGEDLSFRVPMLSTSRNTPFCWCLHTKIAVIEWLIDSDVDCVKYDVMASAPSSRFVRDGFDAGPGIYDRICDNRFSVGFAQGDYKMGNFWRSPCFHGVR
uniref:GP-PDE domain-containing protein n=1 Tax=Steinernema glaseri TaxID=37863 RepID=A0A1I8AVJ5_9BILA